jgi:UDP-glucose 4-epimerase
MNGKRILITGGLGFIGFKLAKHLLKLNADVAVYDNLVREKSENRWKKLKGQGATLIKGDILDVKKLKRSAKNVDTIFHLAAKSKVSESHEKSLEYYQINVNGTLNVLEAAREANSTVIFTSSSTVYGKPNKFPTPETHPCRPISFYGFSKLMAEECCKAYELFRVKSYSLRLYNVYGPEATGGVVYDFLRKLHRNPQRLSVIGSGNQSKDFIYVDDVVNALITIAEEKPKSSVFNVGSGISVKIRNIAEAVVELLGLRNVKIEYDTEPTWVGDVDYTQADITRITRETGWLPNVSLKDGLSRTISWFEQEIGTIKRT